MVSFLLNVHLFLYLDNILRVIFLQQFNGNNINVVIVSIFFPQNIIIAEEVFKSANLENWLIIFIQQSFCIFLGQKTLRLIHKHKIQLYFGNLQIFYESKPHFCKKTFIHLANKTTIFYS